MNTPRGGMTLKSPLPTPLALWNYPSVPNAAPALADHFALIIEALCQAVANRISARLFGHQACLSGPLIVLICSRLRRYKARFTRLATFTQIRVEAP